MAFQVLSFSFSTNNLRSITTEVHKEELQHRLMLAPSNTSPVEEPINMVVADFMDDGFDAVPGH
ncbi:hypothetical protein RvY_11450 [Ramazzottius varieornatus]|uniref:Uncharacterized protein n=1 Tax=Ramazzottius varieornatus TaxID=947166 RepID=A0A1D1VIJ6_RAMVA|nr:hypothetical protein RvY_11450 [Ramazzottius varieornatus]